MSISSRLQDLRRLPPRDRWGREGTAPLDRNLLTVKPIVDGAILFDYHGGLFVLLVVSVLPGNRQCASDILLSVLDLFCFGVPVLVSLVLDLVCFISVPVLVVDASVSVFLVCLATGSGSFGALGSVVLNSVVLSVSFLLLGFHGYLPI